MCILILGNQRGRYVDAKSEEHQQCTKCSKVVCFLIESCMFVALRLGQCIRSAPNLRMRLTKRWTSQREQFSVENRRSVFFETVFTSLPIRNALR